MLLLMVLSSTLATQIMRTLNVMAITQSMNQCTFSDVKNHRICLMLNGEALDDGLFNEDYDFCFR